MNALRSPEGSVRGFTLLELLVSFSLVMFIMICVGSLVQMLRSSSATVSSNITAFESTRTAFDTMTRLIRQATLQSFVDYNDPTHPTDFLIKSHLHFVSGLQSDLGLNSPDLPAAHAIFFQAPIGLTDNTDLRANNALLNSVGFYLAYGEQPARPPLLASRLPSRFRYRLYLFVQPREDLEIYARTLQITAQGIPISQESYSGTDWFSSSVNAGAQSHLLAENVVALLISPVSPSGIRSMAWNSRVPGDDQHRLPQNVRIAMAVIDEPSALRLEEAGDDARPLVPANFYTPTTPPADDEFEARVAALESLLAAHPLQLRYRVFRADLPLTPSTF